jgi:hypothetical protein
MPLIVRHNLGPCVIGTNRPEAPRKQRADNYEKKRVAEQRPDIGYSHTDLIKDLDNFIISAQLTGFFNAPDSAPKSQVRVSHSTDGDTAARLLTLMLMNHS